MPAPVKVPIGGQALVEGVMMRSPNFVAGAVRRADGTITTHLEPFGSIAQKMRWLGWPFIRGVAGLFEMVALGIRFLRWSADFALEYDVIPGTTEANPDKPAEGAPKPQDKPDKLPPLLFFLTAGASFGLGLLLFVALPHLIADWTLGRETDNRVALNLVETTVKLALFIAYVWLIGKRATIRRVFEYHGAEHKVVFAVEQGREISPAGARDFDTPHPRCGTGFALLTVFVSAICFSFLPWTNSKLTDIAMRFVLMPVVAAVSYEIIKLTVHPRLGPYARKLMIPGMWLQRLTTRQPDDSQLEVSCAAMQAVLDAEANRQNQTATPPAATA